MVLSRAPTDYFCRLLRLCGTIFAPMVLLNALLLIAAIIRVLRHPGEVLRSRWGELSVTSP